MSYNRSLRCCYTFSFISLFLFLLILHLPYLFFFFLNDPAPPEIYPLPLHAALPIPPHFGCPPPARPSTPPGPFTQALRQPGVPRGAAFDEFGAAGLGRHRHTEDWLAHRA